VAVSPDARGGGLAGPHSTLVDPANPDPPGDAGQWQRLRLGLDSIALCSRQATPRLDGEVRAGLRNRLIGFVFQHHHLLDELDARDNVALPLRIAKWPARRARARAEELLASVALTERASHFPDQLSGGEQQRVAVARALAASPRLLLADEPTGNLDHANAEQVFALIRELHLMVGLTSIIVTHNEAMARRCDRIFRLAPPGERSGYVRTI